MVEETLLQNGSIRKITISKDQQGKITSYEITLHNKNTNIIPIIYTKQEEL
jgi:hypothetical protein